MDRVTTVTSLKVLIVDRDREAARMLAAGLRRVWPELTWEYAGTQADFAGAAADTFDVVLFDYSLPGPGPSGAADLLRERNHPIPLVVVADAQQDIAAASADSTGAAEYVLRDRLDDLGPAVERILGRKVDQEQNQAARALQFVESVATELVALSRTISSSSDISVVFPLFADHLRKFFQFDRIVISLVDWERERYWDAFAGGLSIPGVEVGEEIDLDLFTLRESLERGENLLLPETEMQKLAPDSEWVRSTIATGLKNSLFVPLRIGDQTVGAMFLWTVCDTAYSESDLTLAEQAGTQIAGVIALDNLNKRIRQDMTELQTLAEFSQVISSSTEIADVFPTVAEHIKKIVPFDRITISLVDWEQKVFGREYESGTSIAQFGLEEKIDIDSFPLRDNLESGESLLLPGVKLHELAKGSERVRVLLEAGLKHCLFAPLRFGDQSIGVLFLWTRADTPYSDRDLAAAEQVATQIAGVVSLSNTNKRLQREIEEQELLARIGRIIAASTQMGNVHDEIGDAISEILPYDRMFISTLVDDGPEIEVAHSWGVPHPSVQTGTRFSITDAQIGLIMSTSKPSLVGEHNIDKLGDMFPMVAADIEIDHRSQITVPLISDNRTIGVLGVRSAALNAYNSRDVELAVRIAGQLAVEIENDALTAELKRKAAEERVIAEIGRVVSHNLDLGQIYSRLADALSMVVPFERLVISSWGSAESQIEFVRGQAVPGLAVGGLFETDRFIRMENIDKTIAISDDGIASAEMLAESGLNTRIQTLIGQSGAPVGVLALLRESVQGFTRAEELLLKQVANQVTPAISNARTHESVLQLGTELTKSEANYRDLVESSHNLVWRVDTEGRFTFVNSTWEKVLGYTADEMLGHPFTDFQSPDFVDRDTHVFSQTVGDSNANDYETSYMTKSGETVTLVFNSLFVLDSDGVKVGAKGTARDVTAQLQAQKRLAESETNYRDLVESSHDLIWRCDGEGRFTYLNPAWERTHGYRVDEMLGRSFTEFQTGETSEQALREFSQHLAGGSVLDYETHHVRKSGEVITLLFNAFPIFDDEGVIVGTKGTARDVTAERQAQEGLAESQQQYRDLYDGSPDMLISLDPASGRILMCNQTALDELGYARDVLIGMHRDNFYHPDSLPLAAEKFIELKRDGAVHDAELRVMRADGTSLIVNLNAVGVFDDDGNIVGANAVLRDITEEVELRESFERAQRALDSTSDMVVFFDTELRCTYVNDAFVATTGYSRNEVIGEKSPLQESDHMAEDIEHAWSLLRSGRVWSGVQAVYRKDGSKYYDQTTTAPVFDDEGSVSSFISIKRDITERVDAESIINQSIAKQDLISTVEHELRSPLAAVINFVDVLRKSETRRPEIIESLKSSAKSLASTINDLRKVSSGSVLDFPIKRSRSNLSALLHDVIERLRPLSENKKLSFKTGITDDLDVVEIEVDGARIIQVFSNLIENAVRYSPSESTIEIELGRGPGSFTRFRIYNEGSGVSVEELELVTRLYFRGENTRVSSVTGSGIGLALSTVIVESHNGHMTIRSEPGEFFEVEVLLPNPNLD